MAEKWRYKRMQDINERLYGEQPVASPAAESRDVLSVCDSAMLTTNALHMGDKNAPAAVNTSAESDCWE